MKGLAIRDVAEQTGLAAGTIRMWEQRYGFPVPERTASGYRRYSPEDVDLLRRVVGLRETGLSVPAALERARAASDATDRPSIFAALPTAGRTRPLRKRSLVAVSRAIEEQALASAAGPVVVAAFQREINFRGVEHRYRRLAAAADASAVLADFAAVRVPDRGPAEVPIDPSAPVAQEWAVVVDAPGLSVCLVAWEPPVLPGPEDDLDREFEAFLTLDPATVRRAAHAGASVAAATAPEVGARLEAALASRPLAGADGGQALEALMLRLVGYLG